MRSIRLALGLLGLAASGLLDTHAALAASAPKPGSVQGVMKDPNGLAITGFNEITPGYGIHTEALHIVQRVTRPNMGRLVIDTTATDPRAWTGPYVMRHELGLVTGDELQEWVCAENN